VFVQDSPSSCGTGDDGERKGCVEERKVFLMVSCGNGRFVPVIETEETFKATTTDLAEQREITLHIGA